MTGRHCAELAILSAGLLVSLLGGWFAIPAFGQLGAAVSTCCGIAVATAGRVLIARRVLGRLPFGGDVAVATAVAVALAALAAAFTAQLPWPGPARAAAGAGAFLLLYGATAWRLLLQPGERLQLRGVWHAVTARLAGATP